MNSGDGSAYPDSAGEVHVSDQARRVVEQGMEVRGGNGYIEEWPNARLLRDVEVQAIWEGTGNISALDVGRAILREHAGAALLVALSERLRAVKDPSARRAAHLTQRALDQMEGVIDGLEAKSADERDLVMRRLTRQLAHIVSAALLVEQADVQARKENNYRMLAQTARYLRRTVSAHWWTRSRWRPPGVGLVQRDSGLCSRDVRQRRRPAPCDDGKWQLSTVYR